MPLYLPLSFLADKYKSVARDIFVIKFVSFLRACLLTLYHRHRATKVYIICCDQVLYYIKGLTADTT